jgi:hypothetical protein
MKKTLFGFMLMAVMAGGTAMASAQDGWRRDRDERREVWRDRDDRRADYRDMRNDRQAIAHDRWELNRDLREGNYRAAEREREEIRERYRDLNRDRRDVRRDNYDLRHDRDWDRR